MTATAISCFVVIVLGACLRAFAPRRSEGEPRRRARGLGADLVLGAPLQPLDLVGERRGPSASAPFGLARPRGERDDSRFGD